MDKPSLLIIDDEPLLLSSLARLLELEFNVLTASNGKEGLKKFESNPSLSIILLDLLMPVMNGLEVLWAIRAMDKNIKVVIMTGTCSYEWATQCADLNVQGYIQKPLDPDELLSRIRKLTERDHNELFSTLWGDDYSLKMSTFSPLVRKTIALVDEKFRTGLGRDDIAGSLKVSPDHLSKVFRKECGFHLSRYINERRIYESKMLLSKPEKIFIAEVASRVGVKDVHYFSRLFKKYAGVSPKAYKKNK